MSLLTKYKNRYAGTHKPTTIRIYTALHAFIDLPDGARPKVDTIADMAGVSRRTANTAIELLATDGLLQVDRRFDGHGRPLPNYYTLLPIGAHKSRSSDVQIPADTAQNCTGLGLLEEVPEVPEVEKKEEEDIEALIHRTGLDTPTVCTVAHGDGGAQAFDPGVQDKQEPLNLDQTMGKRRNVFTDPGLRDGARANSSSALDYKQPLADPALEQQAVNILERLDKLRVSTMHADPLTPGSRPGQLTAARYLVAFNQVDYDETLDLLEWLFSGAHGTKGWATKVTKVFEFRKHYSELLDGYRKHLANGSWPPKAGDVAVEENIWPNGYVPMELRSEEEQADFRRRLMAHKA